MKHSGEENPPIVTEALLPFKIAMMWVKEGTSEAMLNSRKNRKIAAVLAFAGAAPLSLPGLPGMEVHLVGLHKFYLGQPWWGLLYVILGWTPMPWIAGVAEGIWYLAQDEAVFDRYFNPHLDPDTATTQGLGARAGAIGLTQFTGAVIPPPVKAVTPAESMRELDQLRQEGLISEYEFEQKRRKLLERMG
ncbi:MAG: SHOCT domain-containing protein [Synechococcales bacterium]|nr:SHOCT domain-containing protein [Synechococcales bacterium]